MSAFPVQIVSRKNSALLNALFRDDITRGELREVEKEWKPIRLAGAKKLMKAGRLAEIPSHYHWDWDAKSATLDLLAYQCFGIEYEKKIEGLMLVRVAGVNSRLSPDKGKPLVYIDYIESAPWNLKAFTEEPKFSGIGPVFVRAAIQLSHEEGFQGRIGLHSLEQSEWLYRDEFNMKGCGKDKAYYDLPYYEMTRDVALQFTSNSSAGGT